MTAPRSLLDAIPIAVAGLRTKGESRDNRVSKCADDIQEFMRYCYLNDPVLGDIPFDPWDWQPGMLDTFVDTRLLVVLKARQLGVSWLVAIYVLWVAMFRSNQRILLVSIGDRESKRLLEKVSYLLRKLPEWLRPPRTLVRENTSLIRFTALDSEIESLPSTGSIGRSRSASVVVLDEHAHQANADDIFVAIEPTIQRGQLISISTANGLGVLHTRLYKDAVEDANGFTPVFIPWSAHPERDEEWREQERRRLSASAQPQLFAQEYPDNDVEAFVQSGNPVFTDDEVQRQPVERVTPREPGLWVYREPEPGQHYVIGADPSEGTGGDWCSATALRIWKDEEGYHAEQVAQMRGQWPPEQFAVRLHALANLYGRHREPRRQPTCQLGVERNNHGHAVLLRLRQLNADDSTYTVTYWSRGLGWVTNAKTRPLLTDDLAGAIREGQLVFHDPVTQSQMSTWQYTARGADHQQGYHDDDLFAAGIAWAHHRRAFGVLLDVRRSAENTSSNGHANGKATVSA